MHIGVAMAVTERGLMSAGRVPFTFPKLNDFQSRFRTELNPNTRQDGNPIPPAALVGGVDSEDVQLFFAVFLGVQAEEVLPVLVQVVDEVPVEAVLGDDVDGACEGRRQIRVVNRRQSAG